jgi:hypothetical protein
MSRRLLVVALVVCCLVSIRSLGQGQSTPKSRGIVFELRIVETTGDPQKEISSIEAGADALNRLIAEGKAKLVASLQVRTRIGESFSARLGERVPIQTTTLPAIRTSDRSPRDSGASIQSQTSVGFPQIAYENTGLALDGSSSGAGDGLLDIKLKIEMTGVDVRTGTLTPTFTQRTFTDVVRMKESETAVLMGLVPPGSRQLSLDQIASGASSATRGGLLVMLTTRPVQ